MVYNYDYFTQARLFATFVNKEARCRCALGISFLQERVRGAWKSYLLTTSIKSKYM